MVNDAFPISRPSPWQLLAAWLSIGAQSFGGGAATLALIRQSLVLDKKWLTDAQYVEDWAMCQIAPGINLLGFTIIIGRRLAGVWGIAASLAGLLLPSVLATTLLTAGYARFAHLRAVEATLRGVVPAVVGISLVTAFSMARPALAIARREGLGSLVMAVLVLAGSATALLMHSPVVFILVAAGVMSGLWNWGRAARRRGA
jgi:chromate transporter